ncbi:NADH-quinone oxidoreductase subunit C [Salirhabdus sp. Marseille-P4669]|uniref:NADH-quinone oxidoreductase subunit C n=1 Tax=Salirhabdus sp. Marseille-P4669 TaxID=2042310 RepID=UPI001F18AB94|nr:NADH-quinone oxidoreductase subunit C [Salirhabdus sp. Marseille-P4669]
MSNEEKDLEDLQKKKDLEAQSDQPSSQTSELKSDASTEPDARNEANQNPPTDTNKEMQDQSTNDSPTSKTEQEGATEPSHTSTTKSSKKPNEEPTSASSKDETNTEKTTAKKSDAQIDAQSDEKPERPKRPPRKRKKKDEEPKEEAPSPKQPQLESFVQVIEEHLGKNVLAENYINRLSKHIPTIVAKPEHYFQLAKFLKEHEELAFTYLSDIHGVDYETHMEVYVHLYSLTKNHSIALKVKVDRDNPTIDSLTPIWEGANWPESETYDLLGIQFTGHPDLKRILLGEDWKGHPLRKDYEPYDVEV